MHMQNKQHLADILVCEICTLPVLPLYCTICLISNKKKTEINKKSYILYIGIRINLIFGISGYSRLRAAACIDPVWTVNTARFFSALLWLSTDLNWVVWVRQHQWHRRKQPKIYQNAYISSVKLSWSDFLQQQQQAILMHLLQSDIIMESFRQTAAL